MKKLTKRTMKRLLAMLMVLTMLLSVVPVHAGEVIFGLAPKHTMILYPSAKDNVEFLTTVTGVSGSKVSITSSNPGVATVTKKNETFGASISATAKKAGTTKFTLKINNKVARVCTVTVKKYTNPIWSVKVGNKAIGGSKFNKVSTYNLKYNDFKNKKTKITVKLQKGWEINNGIMKNQMDYFQKGWKMSETFKNGSAIPIKGGAGFEIWISVINTKTHVLERVRLIFK